MPPVRTIAPGPVCYLLAACMFLVSAQVIPAKEYQVKAVFLFNFVQFVDWPQSSFSSDDSPFVIGILGDDPFGSYLDETINHEKLEGHPLEVRHYSDVSEVKQCHMLFANLTDGDLKALKELKQQPILIVGEASEDFIKNGGMIGFFLEKGKIRMRINLEAIKKADLNISSKLLRVAEIVTVKK